MTKSHILVLMLFAVFLQTTFASINPDFEQLCADRTAIEQVYHKHRTGTKLPFEQMMPRAVLENMVREEILKEATLARVYDVSITHAMVDAEVSRINTTTRAPEILAEIKKAFGDSPKRFASSMARPFIVDRLLREKFQNDNALHAPQRREAVQARERLMSNLPVPATQQINWHLTPRPAEETPKVPEATEPVTGTGKSANYTVEATLQIAQVLPPPAASVQAKEMFYFDEIEPQLQSVLHAQLQKPGDVSAVIEAPEGFLVFQLKEKTDLALTVTNVSIAKISYETWLARQLEP